MTNPKCCKCGKRMKKNGRNKKTGKQTYRCVRCNEYATAESSEPKRNVYPRHFYCKQTSDAKRQIEAVVDNTIDFDWQDKFDLAPRMAAEYELDIGIVNHLIEQAMRKKGTNEPV